MKQIILVAIAFLLIGCNAPGVNDENLTAAIQEREDAWSAAFNAGDAEALGDIYEEESVIIPPGADPVWGRENVVGVLSDLFGVLHDVQLTADNVRPMGENFAVEVGHGTYDTIAEDGSRVPSRIDYVVTWHRGDDGVWRYTTDIFNASAAP